MDSPAGLRPPIYCMSGVADFRSSGGVTICGLSSTMPRPRTTMPAAYYDALVGSSLGPLPAHLALSSAGVNSTRKLQELACRVLRGVAATRKTTTVELWGDSHMRNLFSDWMGLDRYASSGAAEIARQRSDCGALSPL